MSPASARPWLVGLARFGFRGAVLGSLAVGELLASLLARDEAQSLEKLLGGSEAWASRGEVPSTLVEDAWSSTSSDVFEAGRTAARLVTTPYADLTGHLESLAGEAAAAHGASLEGTAFAKLRESVRRRALAPRVRTTIGGCVALNENPSPRGPFTEPVSRASGTLDGEPVVLELAAQPITTTSVLEIVKKLDRLGEHENVAQPITLGNVGVGSGRGCAALAPCPSLVEWRASAVARRLPLSEVLGVLAGVFRAVEHAHSRSVLHMRLRPEYVSVVEGVAKVGGFWASGAQTSFTQLSYPSPFVPWELDRPQRPADLAPAGDVFSLGALFHWLFTREPPSSTNLVGRSPQYDLLPPYMGLAVRKALSDLPANRYPTVAAFREALRI